MFKNEVHCFKFADLAASQSLPKTDQITKWYNFNPQPHAKFWKALDGYQLNIQGFQDPLELHY